MPKILVINGSPNKQSVTLRATKAFVQGILDNSDSEVTYLNISEMNITPCKGCLSCWGRTEGCCVIKNDDMQKVYELVKDADIVIQSFPLYVFGVPGILKVFMDRMLPFMMTYKGQPAPQDGESFHGIRYHKDGQKLILISSCAYSDSKTIYDSVLLQYDYICGKGKYYPILLPQLKTLCYLNNENRINRYMKKLENAGKSFIEKMDLTEQELIDLRKPPFLETSYKQFLNNFWDEEKRK